MSQTSQRIGAYEPSVRTVEMVCDRLAELGLAIGPDTARALVREVLAAEGPRIDARLRESIDTALQTIKVAAQSAMGLLATSGARAAARVATPTRASGPAASRAEARARARAAGGAQALGAEAVRPPPAESRLRG